MIPLTPRRLLQLVAQSLRQPKAVMQQILAINVTRKQLYLLMLLLVVIDLMSGLLMEILIPGAVGGGRGLSRGVAPFFILQLFTILGGAVLVYNGGRVFGGQGSFDDCLKMTIWLNFVFFVLHFLLPITSLVAPQLGGLAFLAIVVLAFVQMTAYVMVIHKFDKLLPVVFGIIAAQFFFGIFLVILLGMLGINIGMEPG